MLLTCVSIFLARIVDVSLGTIRTVYIVRGERLKGAIIAFFEVFIWFMVAREALNISTTSLLVPVFYAGGYATGTYIGTIVSNKVVGGLISVQVITQDKYSKKLAKEIREAGYGVSIIDLKDAQDHKGKDMLLIELNKKELKNLTNIIKYIDDEAFIIVNETKFVQNGLIK